MTEEQKNEWAAMEDRLMPVSGKAETVAGEIIRAVDRIWYRWYNDGDKINVGYGKETCNGTARFLEKIRGSEFPAEVWNGSLDDDGYTKFTDRLVDEMYAFIKARGYAIYPGKVTEAETFRIGNIGEIYKEDIEKLISIYKEFLASK